MPYIRALLQCPSRLYHGHRRSRRRLGLQNTRQSVRGCIFSCTHSTPRRGSLFHTSPPDPACYDSLDEPSGPVPCIRRFSLSRRSVAPVGGDSIPFGAEPRAASLARSCDVAGICTGCDGQSTGFRMGGGSFPGDLCLVDRRGASTAGRHFLGENALSLGRHYDFVVAGSPCFGVTSPPHAAHRREVQRSPRSHRRLYLRGLRLTYTCVANLISASNEHCGAEPVPPRRWCRRGTGAGIPG
jgi:hypothetical protein